MRIKCRSYSLNTTSLIANNHSCVVFGEYDLLHSHLYLNVVINDYDLRTIEKQKYTA